MLMKFKCFCEVFQFIIIIITSNDILSMFEVVNLEAGLIQKKKKKKNQRFFFFFFFL